MSNIKKLDSSRDFNDLLIEIAAEKTNDFVDRKLFIRQSFIVWYILLEGHICKDFKEADLRDQLQNNYRVFFSEFDEDPDCEFIYGWMINLSFWLFDDTIDESLGKNYMISAHKMRPTNLLFKWAIRDALHWENGEKAKMERDLKKILIYILILAR